VEAVLRSLHLAKVDAAAIKSALKRNKTKVPKWTIVAAGRRPVPGHPERISYFHPAKPEQSLAPGALGLMSVELAELLKTTRLEEKHLENCQALAVVPGDLLARGVPEEGGETGEDVFGRELSPSMETQKERMEPGAHVSLSPEGGYRAEGHGYMCLLEGKLSVLSPLWVDEENMKAYWLLLDDGPHPVTPEMVHLCLAEQGIKEGIREDTIQALVLQVQQGVHRRGMVLIAEGTPPVDGQDAEVKILVDIQRRSGKEREDGSIDFHEVNFMPNVGNGQQVAYRRPPTMGVTGKDIKGRLLPVKEGKDKVLKAGDNVRVQLVEGCEHFTAQIDGALIMARAGDEIAVVALLQVNGDVSFATGNLNFGGEVVVKGSIVQGFCVEAIGDITIAGTVESGAKVTSRGDITISGGIVGRRTRVAARGSVRAQFVQEATVTANEDIVLGNYAYYAELRSGGKTMALKGKGRYGGGIIGGLAWGRKGIEAHVAGTRSSAPTLLVAGLDTEQAEKLDKVQTNIDISYQHIVRILKRFNLDQIDVSQIRHMIAAAVGPRRRILAQAAQRLGQLTQIHQKLVAARQALQETLGQAAQDVEIQIHEKVYPGVELRLGEHKLKITNEMKTCRFHVVEDKLATA
jgi:hypothetical protein